MALGFYMKHLDHQQVAKCRLETSALVNTSPAPLGELGTTYPLSCSPPSHCNLIFSLLMVIIMNSKFSDCRMGYSAKILKGPRIRI